jgi:general secretion pathway protein E
MNSPTIEIPREFIEFRAIPEAKEPSDIPSLLEINSTTEIRLPQKQRILESGIKLDTNQPELIKVQISPTDVLQPSNKAIADKPNIVAQIKFYSLDKEPAILESNVISLLLDEGRVGEAEISRARRLAAENGEPAHRMLAVLGLVSERDLAQIIAKLLDLPIAQTQDYPSTPPIDNGISLRFMKDMRLVPLVQDQNFLIVAMADPTDPFPIKAVELATGLKVAVKVGMPGDVDSAIERLYGEGRSAMRGIADGLDGTEVGNEDDIERLKETASEAPVIRLVNMIIQKAVEARASDIHIEPFEGQLKVRYRIDGVLQDVEAPPARSTLAVISRIKIMAKLNIAERRLPQDGRIPLRIQGKELDLRVSSVPTMHGESVVMRLLDKASIRFDFDILGFDGTPRDRLLKVLDQPHGIILVTGPTGSGKSTTLYTALSRINTPESKIITVEDPVEYQLTGVNQIQVKPQIGLTFSTALRSIVRQDPDIIMIGEMRDLETAHIAVQSALTGHLVLSTLHTNNAAGGVSRLLDMGVEDYLLTSTVNGIVGQRLVRRLCSKCRVAYVPSPEIIQKLYSAIKTQNIEVSNAERLTIFKPQGCVECGNTGYFGRLAIAEVLLMSETLRQTILRHATATEIQRIAQNEGMASMYEDGMRKVLAGLTTLEEVIRVTQSDDIE